MRYITKQLEESLRFFGLFDSINYYQDMSDCCEAITHKTDLTRNEMYSIFANYYEVCFQRDFKENVYKNECVKRLAFNENGKLRPLNESIYVELAKLGIEHKKFAENEFIKAHYDAKIIKDGRYSRSLKRLARLDKHDLEVDFSEIDDNLFVITYKDYNYCDEKVVFRTLDKNIISDLDILSFKNVQVLYEELFICGNNLYEYNILLKKWNPAQLDFNLNEISVTFSKVEHKRVKRYVKESSAEKKVINA